MVARKGGGPKGFLGLAHQLSFRYAQDKRSLVVGSHRGGYPVIALPSPMDAFAWIQKVQLYNLVVVQKSLGVSINSYQLLECLLGPKAASI